MYITEDLVIEVVSGIFIRSKQKKEKIKRCIMYQTARKSADIMNVKNVEVDFYHCRQ